MDTTITVLTNSLALHDVPDGVGQLVIEEPIGVPTNLRIDDLAAARKAVEISLSCISSWSATSPRAASTTQHHR